MLALGGALTAPGLAMNSRSVDLEHETPPEIGRVAWQRELAPALEQSRKTLKPVLLLFQEIPG